MANTVTITKVNYANTANAGQTWTFEYKLYNASTWTLGSNSKVVDASGTLAVPLALAGLTTGQLYYVRSSNNCSSPAEYYIQQIQL